MRLDSKLLSLPASILLLVASHPDIVLAGYNKKAGARWPFNLVTKLPNWNEYGPNRDAETIDGNTGTGRTPVGVMKMSDNEGEKFYMEYWQFGGNVKQSPMLSPANPSLRTRDNDKEHLLLVNASHPISYRPAFALHTDSEFRRNQDLRARGSAALIALENRDFTCPAGTSACSAIGYPNSCCATDENCFAIQDTGLGPVGCCPNGSSCGGEITTCDTPNLACPDNLGGGCCIPNYICAGIGCVLNSTVVTSVSSSTTQSSSSSTIVTIVSPITVTTTVTPTTAQSTTQPTSTYTGLQTTLVCSTNSHACPVGMGGGCCGNGYACASMSSCLPLSSTSTTSSQTTATVTGVVPVRPTGDTTTLTSSTDLVTTCPTGFYACEAYYGGGCCRTGRNCDTTSCPATSSTTIISSGATIVVPIGAAATTANPTGNCASGWFTCAASVGGNCCPSGYQCGTASCSLAQATTTVFSPKEATNMGGKLEVRGVVIVILSALMAILFLT